MLRIIIKKLLLSCLVKNLKKMSDHILCEACAEDDEIKESEIPAATMHCTTCDESLCGNCSASHKKLKVSRNHTVHPIDENLTKKFIGVKHTLQSDKVTILCDCCKADNENENGNIPNATMFCTNCEELHCDACSKAHRKQKLFKDHKISPINDKIKRKVSKAKKIYKSDEETISCDSCNADKENENDEVPKATVFCTNCEECQCETCSKAHRKQKLFKDHKIVPINEEIKKKVSQMKKISKSDEETIFCDSCNADKENENDEVPKATVFCTNCEECHCETCSKAHRKQRLFKNHKIVAINEEIKKKVSQMKKTSKSDEETIFFDSFITENDSDNEKVPSATKVCSNCEENHWGESCRTLKNKKITEDDQAAAFDEEIKKRLNKDKTSSKLDKCAIMCDTCNVGNKNDAVSKATVHCIKCAKNHCDSCSTEHKSQEASKHHVTVLIDESTRKMYSIVNRSAETTLRTNANSSSTDCDAEPIRLKNPIENELLDLLKEESFSKIRLMIKRPTIKETNLENFLRFALPYIIQRIKFWNGYALSPQNIAGIVERTQKRKTVSSFKDNTSKERTTYPISRLDCIAYIINGADSIVVQDILRIMSKFPMAMPLVIPDIRESGKYKVIDPAMQNIIVKWESTPGHIAENHLFSSPFRMIAAVRLGSNKIGKSTILNQLMRKQFMFSSSGEPGSKYGRPLTLDGTVEIVWLTQETCSDTTWKTTVCDHYKRGTSEVAILANLHGDSLQYADTLKYLEHLACSFIVFRMPNSTNDEFQQLRKSFSSKKIVSVWVDPKENLEEEEDMETIGTDSLSSDDTHDTVRTLLRLCLEFHLSRNSIHRKPLFRLEKCASLRYTESLQCKKSEEILDIVRQQGCFSIKQLLLNIDVQQYSKWNESLKCLLTLFMGLFNQQQSDAKKSLTYIENQLSQLSANESIGARAQVSEANEKLRRIVKAPKRSTARGNFKEMQHQADVKKAQEELNSAMEKVDSINLGQEHFLRALGHMYEKSFRVTDLGDFNSIREVPHRVADLLISGHAIEVLNGDLGEIQLVWIKAVCEDVTKKLQNLKVFVISIIGLQSSGKSTLLNALFSCRFAVSVGRCSRGLFMRMILMDETLRKAYGCDAIILIDTEGLCSPEKMNDPKASQKDRLMATFAMGVSNLTIVNILGEGMTEMTEVLQIAIVAMARLRGGGIKPDILMVQHLQERNLSKIDQAKGQFCEAINKAFELISKNDVEIGSASEECLAELTARIQSGDIFKHFGAFRDGSSVNSPPSETYHEDVVSLFETLLKRTQALETKSTFERWSNHFQSYWICVREEKFALNFKNVKHITDFLYFEKKIAKVKELNDSSLRCHRDIFANKIREEINLMIENKPNARTDSMREGLLHDMADKLQTIPHNCHDNCGKCKEFKTSYISLMEEILSSEWGEETKHLLEKYNDRLHETTMKVLRQTFDGSALKQGYFSEFSDLITKELNQALKRRPTGQFSEEEQKIIVDNIWQHLQSTAASKESTPDLQIRMNQALLQTYVNTGIFTNIFRDLSSEVTVEDLIKRKAIKSKITAIKIARMFNYDKLTNDQMTSLLSVLEQLVFTVLRSRREDYSKTGLDFDEGMVSEIKTNFPAKMKEYEVKFNITLHDEFKMSLQIYTLQQFKNVMTNLQTLFNRQNNPSEILLQKKDDYINEIETRLKYGFSCAGEGEIVARRLYKSIKLNAIQAGYDAKVQAVKDAPWTTNSEKVRLHYFEQLTNEVAAGNKVRALAHFAEPKSSIELWFAKEVNSLISEKSVLEIYHSTLKQELNRVRQQITKCDKKADIDKIVKEQIKNADDQYYSQLDPKDDDFDAFRSSIVRILDSFVYAQNNRKVEFGSASDSPEIQRRLGCCEHCYWCGALCWGSRDHMIEKNSVCSMEMHLSCHQPNGLTGVSNRTTKILSCIACHNQNDKDRVWFKEFQDDAGMLWSEAKENHFKDWKFDAHCVTTFDELMRWFFQQLHEDIAKIRGVLPADDKELKENGCSDLNLDEILDVVRSRT